MAFAAMQRSSMPGAIQEFMVPCYFKDLADEAQMQ
jgi:hypothetical protein